MEKQGINFDEMRAETTQITSELKIPEFNQPGEALEVLQTSVNGPEEGENLKEASAEEKLFNETGVSSADEAKRISELEAKGASPETIEIEKISFTNIRETIRLYLDALTEEGIFNANKIELQITESKKKALDELVKNEILSDPKYEKFRKLETFSDLEIEWSRLLKQQEKLEIELGVNTFTTPEEYITIVQGTEISNIQADMDILKSIMNKFSSWQAHDDSGSEISKLQRESNAMWEDEATKETVKITPEEAIQELGLEMARVKLQHEITLNLHLGALQKIIQAGQIVSSASLNREQLEDLSRAISETNTSGQDDRYKDARSAEDYMVMRAEAEKELGLESGTIIYGAISTDEKPLGHTSYGDCCLVLKQDAIPGITFSEGDSLSQRNMGFYERKGHDRKAKQLTYKHALISQAVTRAFHQIERRLLDGYTTADYMEYLEAHIPTPVPFDADHISEIRVGDLIDSESIAGLEIPVRSVAA